MLHPTWVFSHATAAFVLGLDVSYNLIWPINFLTDNPGGGKHPPHHKHHRTGYNAFIEKGSIKTTDVLQTVIDCARTYPFGHALAIADSALHQGLIAKGSSPKTILKPVLRGLAESGVFGPPDASYPWRMNDRIPVVNPWSAPS